jgi:sugar lactone lactonase YvrE
MREAKLEFYKGDVVPVAITPSEVNVEVVRKDPAIDAIVPPNPKIFKLAEGFKFTEGPVWDRTGNYLLFSDPNNNTIYKYSPEGNGHLAVFRNKSGYEGTDIAEYGQPGSKGLTFDPEGRLTIDQHGNHRVVRVEPYGQLTVLADKFEGKRLNSPNDLVYRSDGTLYFTDPPFGLPKFFDDPRKELPFSGVFAVKDGNLKLVTQDFTGPNGIAFSPDEKYLYVGDWDEKKKVVMCYEVQCDGSLKNGKLFFDMTNAPGEDAIDGMKIDRAGNLYVSGPGGLWIISPQGKHLGTVIPPKHPHNFAHWGNCRRICSHAVRSRSTRSSQSQLRGYPARHAGRDCSLRCRICDCVCLDVGGAPSQQHTSHRALHWIICRRTGRHLHHAGIAAFGHEHESGADIRLRIRRTYLGGALDLLYGAGAGDAICSGCLSPRQGHSLLREISSLQSAPLHF